MMSSSSDSHSLQEHTDHIMMPGPLVPFAMDALGRTLMFSKKKNIGAPLTKWMIISSSLDRRIISLAAAPICPTTASDIDTVGTDLACSAHWILFICSPGNHLFSRESIERTVSEVWDGVHVQS